MGSSRPPKGTRNVDVGELDREEADWVRLFRALGAEERAALVHIVRSIVGDRRAADRIKIPPSVLTAFASAGVMRAN